MSALSRIESVLFAAKPAERLAAVRILVAAFSLLYLLSRASHLTQFSALPASAFEPVGPIALLSNPWPSSVVLLTFTLCVLGNLFALLGWRYRITGPVWALSLLWVLSYRNSWGMIFHTENLLVLHALVLALAPATDVWSLDARSRRARAAPPSARYAWPLLSMNVITLLSYVVAGVAKLRAAGFAWLGGDEIRSHIAFDALRKLELGSAYSPLGAALVPHAWLFAPLACFSLLLELGAPLALLGGVWARAWVLAAWSFHLGVLLLMAIVFPYPLLGLAYAPLFAAEKPLQRWLWPALARAQTALSPRGTGRT